MKNSVSREFVTVQDARLDTEEEIPSGADFDRWVLLPMQCEEIFGEVTVRIVDLEEMQQINLDYRKINQPTNVLSFSYDDHPEGYLGDVVICAPVVLREAREREIAVNHHWAHLTIHGVLHLMGFDHETEEQASTMEAKEVSYLAELNISNPYELAEVS